MSLSRKLGTYSSSAGCDDSLACADNLTLLHQQSGKAHGNEYALSPHPQPTALVSGATTEHNEIAPHLLPRFALLSTSLPSQHAHRSLAYCTRAHLGDDCRRRVSSSPLRLSCNECWNYFGQSGQRM